MLTRVCKLGGSLLDDPGLGDRLRSWLAVQPAARTVLIVGGGRLVDVLHEQALVHRLADEAAHWLCIEAMGLNTRMLRTLFPEAGYATKLPERPLHDLPPLTLLDTADYLRTDDRKFRDGPLPSSWDVSSDSIAARIAHVLAADDLVLLKSALSPQPRTLARAAATGYVDPCFASVAAGLPRIRCVNLKDPGFADAAIEITGEVLVG